MKVGRIPKVKHIMTPINKRLISASSVFFLLSTPQLEKPAIAQDLGSHVHGLTELNLVIADQDIQIEFISPAINLLGFERASSSPEESQLFNEVVSELQTAEWLIGERLEHCQLSIPVFESPDFEGHGSHEEHEDHEHHEHEDHEHEDHEHEATAHADFRVQYLFDCEATPPTELIITAFDRFDGIEEISARWIVGREQGISSLTSSSPALTFE
tara:strand:+ start:432 stop:1073 length:642 start_codon:yes stop_codon:yes gene_type:complete